MEYDFIIVGGGHNGLVAGAYLARGGARVLLLEKCTYLGGLAATQPYISHAPRHLLSQGAIDTVFIKTTSIVRDLKLRENGLSLIDVDPGYGWVDPDGNTLCIFNDASRTAADIKRFSANDGRSYLNLQEALSRIIKLQLPLFRKSAGALGLMDLARIAMRVTGDREVRRVLGRLVSCSAHEAIAATFECDPLRSLLAYWCEIAGPADVDGSGLNLASLNIIHQLGCSRPQGGMGGLIASLENSFVREGGAVRVGAEVDQVLVIAGRACGVRLVDGSELVAKYGVLTNCAPQVLYTRLLDPQRQSANSRTRVPFIPANAGNMCPFKVDVATASSLKFGKAQVLRNAIDRVDLGATSLMTGSFADHLEHSAALRKGRMGNDPPIWMTVLSHSDRSLAPDGQSVAYLYTSTPALPEGGWESNTDGIVANVMREASRYLDGLDSELGRFVTTPADFERMYGAPRGCIYHVDMSPTRMMLNRPAVGMGGSRSEIGGLYLAGSGSHPGGGVFGMPGKLAAEVALEDKRDPTARRA